MTNDYKYHLAGRNDSHEARKKRSCPKCRQKTFVLYIDRETGEPIHDTVGKCDRADKCAWRYTPKQYFTDKGSSFDKSNSFPPAGRYGLQSPQTKPQRTEPKPSYMDMGYVERSCGSFEKNNLSLWLRKRLGEEAANKAFRRYYVGTSKHWGGATTFPQIDMEGRVRGIKIMLYDGEHRVKDEVDGQYPITWAHAVRNSPCYDPNYNLRQCLFGLHLLKDSTAPVAIVESEKSAVIGSIYHHRYVWLATGGKQNINLIEKAAGQLQGRKEKLVPDLKATADWEIKAQELRRKYELDISVYTYLERRATEPERADGLDIADFLLRNPPPTATEAPQPATLAQKPAIERLQPEAIRSTSEQETAQNRAVARLPKTQGGWYMKTYEQGWSAEIEALETFFDSRKDHLPESVKTGHSVIVNVPLFIESHLERVKAHNGNPTFQPYLDRLTGLKNLLTNLN